MAPYEADSQLAFLSRSGQVDYVITDDTDAAVFGGKNIVFRLNLADGCGKLLEDPALLWKHPSAGLKFMTNEDWPTCANEANFVLSCVIAGCDYYQGVSGIGLKTAARYFELYKTLDKVIDHIKLKNVGLVQSELEVGIEKGYLAYRYPRVWCTRTNTVVYLREPFHESNLNFPESVQGMTLRMNLKEFTEYSKNSFDRKLLSLYPLDDLIGDSIDPEIGKSIASGFLHPLTKQPYNRSIYTCFRKGTLSKSKLQFPPLSPREPNREVSHTLKDHLFSSFLSKLAQLPQPSALPSPSAPSKHAIPPSIFDQNINNSIKTASRRLSSIFTNKSQAIDRLRSDYMLDN